MAEGRGEVGEEGRQIPSGGGGGGGGSGGIRVRVCGRLGRGIGEVHLSLAVKHYGNND